MFAAEVENLAKPPLGESLSKRRAARIARVERRFVGEIDASIRANASVSRNIFRPLTNSSSTSL
jgi:hypothetical protein